MAGSPSERAARCREKARAKKIALASVRLPSCRKRTRERSLMDFPADVAALNRRLRMNRLNCARGREHSTMARVLAALPVNEVPDSPQSVKKIADEEVAVPAQGKDGSSKKSASKKRSRPSPSKNVSKKLNLDAEIEDGDVGSGKDEKTADELSPSNNA